MSSYTFEGLVWGDFMNEWDIFEGDLVHEERF